MLGCIRNKHRTHAQPQPRHAVHRIPHSADYRRRLLHTVQLLHSADCRRRLFSLLFLFDVREVSDRHQPVAGTNGITGSSAGFARSVAVRTTRTTVRGTAPAPAASFVARGVALVDPCCVDEDMGRVLHLWRGKGSEAVRQYGSVSRSGLSVLVKNTAYVNLYMFRY